MTNGRPIEYDPDTVLDAAMQLFWRRGYEATSLQALLQAMKLSKSSLYQAFGSKRELFLGCIERYHQQTVAEMQDRLQTVDSGLAFIDVTLAKVVNEANEPGDPKGCLMTNTANEFAQYDTQIAQKVTAGLNSYFEMFWQAAAMGQLDGTIRRDLTPDQLASYLVTNMSGLRTMVKSGADQAALRQTVNIIVSTVQATAV